MEVNIFSYVQIASAFCNVMKVLSSLLPEIGRGLGRSKPLDPQRFKEFQELSRRAKECVRLLKCLSSLIPKPREFSDFVKELDDFLKGLEALKPEVPRLRELKRKVGELTGRGKALTLIVRRHALEEVVKTLKNEAGLVTRRCSGLLDSLEFAYRRAGYAVARFDAKLLERGLFGASQPFGKLLFEVGLEFDPYLNAPIIPGSSIKGALRAVYEQVMEDNWPPVDVVFGAAGGLAQVGGLIFSDAYPVEPGRNGMILYPDVITPHYSRGGEDILTEWDWEPVPIPHLSVAPGTTFGFIVASRGSLEDEKLERVIRTAFSMGLGGRTCVGYGRLELKVDRIVLRR